MKNKEHVEKKPAKKSTARVIGIIVVLLILVFLNAPQLLFFLSSSQQEAIRLFNETYFGKYLPVQSKDGGFDFLRIISLLFMIAQRLVPSPGTSTLLPCRILSSTCHGPLFP